MQNLLFCDLFYILLISVGLKKEEDQQNQLLCCFLVDFSSK
jgi:hypothetical protein